MSEETVQAGNVDKFETYVPQKFTKFFGNHVAPAKAISTLVASMVLSFGAEAMGHVVAEACREVAAKYEDQAEPEDWCEDDDGIISPRPGRDYVVSDVMYEIKLVIENYVQVMDVEPSLFSDDENKS